MSIDESKLTSDTNDSLRTREENIIRNNRFLADLGFKEPGQLKDDQHKKPKTRQNNVEGSISEEKPVHERSIAEEKPDQRRRSKRLRELTSDEPLKCEDCKSSKIYPSKRYLSNHKNNYCVMSKDYIPNQFRLSKSKNYDNFMLEERGLSTSSDNIVVLSKPIFNVNEDVDEDEESMNSNDVMEEAIIEDTCLNDNYIKSFLLQQEKLCSSLFGKGFLQATDMKTLPIIFKEHLLQSNSPEKRRKIDLYTFIANKGLSREDGDDLLQLVNSYNPSLRTPKSFKSLETSIKKEVASLFEYAEIDIPWVESWKMDKLPGCPPVKIYVRSMFQIISYMLVDPELMIIWRNHVQVTYQKAVDRDGNRVYSNVMSSPWAEETEALVHARDPNGYILPLIFYTDGVQVSPHARNKITPVMITLGNFSDELLQKDISKRVVAYLPNFRGISKDNITQHLMKTLGINKTKVRKTYGVCNYEHI